MCIRDRYVGMTRAKNALYIHCDTDLFSPYSLPGIEHTEDARQYEEPKSLTLQLTHRDVVLDFFKDKKEIPVSYTHLDVYKRQGRNQHQRYDDQSR